MLLIGVDIFCNRDLVSLF